MAAYYNEVDPYAAQWLRNLIAAGRIAPGDVDERSIIDVQPCDIKAYTQCHFFAGIGVWSYALRQAGWTDDRPVWTGSCPCQPFSAAGKGEGTADTRHLWPAWFRLIKECRPVAVFGEQVSAAIRFGWLDAVQADMESLGYAVGAAVVGAHSVGAPHIRQRLYFMADCDGSRRGEGRASEACDGRGSARVELAGFCPSRGVEHAASEQMGLSGRAREPRVAVGDSNDTGSQRRSVSGTDSQRQSGSEFVAGAAGASFWSTCDWLPCIDGKARPVEPGTFPLAHGASARVGRLRAYGNAICAETATAFIKAYLSV